MTLRTLRSADARTLGVNLSRAAERGLRETVAGARRQRWQSANAGAIAAWNARVVLGGAGHVVDMRAGLLPAPATRVVVPLVPEDLVRRPIADLDPRFEIGGERDVPLPRALAATPLRALARLVASPAAEDEWRNPVAAGCAIFAYMRNGQCIP